MNLIWLVLPLIAALIGWFTNFIAVRMIFRPYRPIRLLFFTLQGLLPKRRDVFAKSIGATISDHLIGADDISNMVHDPRVSEKLHGVFEDRIDNFLTEKILSLHPMIGMVLTDDIKAKLKAMLMDQIKGALESGVDALGDHIEDNLDLSGLVERKIADFEMSRLEAIVLEVAARELRSIEILGAVLGFMVGLVQVLLLQWL